MILVAARSRGSTAFGSWFGSKSKIQVGSSVDLHMHMAGFCFAPPQPPTPCCAGSLCELHPTHHARARAHATWLWGACAPRSTRSNKNKDKSSLKIAHNSQTKHDTHDPHSAVCDVQKTKPLPPFSAVAQSKSSIIFCARETGPCR